MTISSLGERALIDRITARLAMPSWVVVGPGDDAAVIEPERGTLEVLTTDALVEGVHFDRRFVPPDAIGYRALAVNLSDLAAMGAHPRAALLSLILPASLEVSALDGLIDGLVNLASGVRLTVIGGNITQSPGPLIVDVTAIGAVRRRCILTRGGARPGDAVYVTGALGDAAVGLRALQRCATASGETAHTPLLRATNRYLRPEPRMRAGALLGRNRAASSCMDLSDGLADAVRQVCAASGVGVKLDAAALPIGEDVRTWHGEHGGDPVTTALSGGDDYELLFTARPTQRGRLRAVQQQMGNLPITRIGEVTKARDMLIADDRGVHELPSGFEHFR